ncbi:MAG TPA: TetR/AcrR family transcriptional regulator [Gammaproteobacteria bacterium]|nr:TetR/AcrR family transcriptional regulator [Gammaproteobacteria bacterium]
MATPHFRADPTREKILKAARKLFIEKGFSGTSIGKIAEKAGINHSLIFHHFGNKEGLWKSTKQSIVEKYIKISPVLPKTNQSFPQFLNQLMTQCIAFYRSNPDIIRMVSWQRCEYKSKKEIGLTLSAESKAWLTAFEYYQDKGEINKKLKPEFILTLVLSIVSSAAMDPNVFIQETNDLNKYIKFCLEGLLKLLK